MTEKKDDVFIQTDPPKPFDPSEGALLLLIATFDRDHTNARVFGIQVHDVHDGREMRIGVKLEEQHEWLKPWIEVFRYGNVTSEFDSAASVYKLIPASSWHSVFFGTIPARAKTLIEEDYFWQQHSSINVALMEAATRRIIDRISTYHPDHPL